MLTDTAIKALKPKEKLYKIVDRDGMYVVVQPSGSIVFRLDCPSSKHLAQVWRGVNGERASSGVGF